MTSEDFFDRVNKRDFSGSEEDKYLQDLFTMFRFLSLNGQERQFFELLEKADSLGKKLTFEYDKGTTRSEYDISEIFMV
jgi:hypothetical protein